VSCLDCSLGFTSQEGSTTCLNMEHTVGDMGALFNKVSNHITTEGNVGNNIMINGDTALLVRTNFICESGGGFCSDSETMLASEDLNGLISCASDAADCIINGDYSRRQLYVVRTGEQKLILRALTFERGSGTEGGALYIIGHSSVEIQLCRFNNCKSTNQYFGGGGGAIYVTGGNLDIFGSLFAENSATSGYGKDIYNLNSVGTITVHNTCPSPYTENTAFTGKN